MKIEKLNRKAGWLRRRILEMAVKAGAGHVAPSFSCVEILTSLYYGGILKFDPLDPEWRGRDRFILSKGQAAVALYAVLADRAFFPVEELDKFTQPGSFLGGHAEDRIPGVEAFTGSLGHGLPIGCGMALSAKLDRRDFRVFVLLGDGECHEGSVWEAAMFAAGRRLDNMIAIVDHNGLSATDYLENYLDVAPFKEKWESFGWTAETADGHSIVEITEKLKTLSEIADGKPKVLIARTVKGKGVSFMENRPIWHYRIPVGEELEQARRELGDPEREEI